MTTPADPATQENTIPVLEAALIPRPIRHGAIQGALRSLEIGAAMIILAPHKPKKLDQLVEELDESFDLTYLKEEETEYQIQLTRTA